jgi:hypothetical protein
MDRELFIPLRLSSKDSTLGLYHPAGRRLKQIGAISVQKTSYVASRIATKDCFIAYKGNHYSVPFRYVRRALTVRDRGNGVF